MNCNQQDVCMVFCAIESNEKQTGHDVAIALTLCFLLINIASFVLYLCKQYIDYHFYLQWLLFVFVNSRFFSCCVSTWTRTVVNCFQCCNCTWGYFWVSMFFLAIKIYHFLNFIYINHKYGVIIYGVVCFGLFRFVSLFLIVMLYCFGTVSCNFALFLWFPDINYLNVY